MKASELVKQLNELIEKHGDQVVTFASEAEPSEEAEEKYGDECDISAISCFEGDSGKIERFMICDYETMMSFL